MTILYESAVPNPNELFIRGPQPLLCDWLGRKALQLGGPEASLLLVPGLSLAQGWIEVDLGSEGAAYPGIAFRLRDSLNFELAYIQPHTSGQWDALQYDPVFHGSNTWQLYYGSQAQQAVDVPAQTWHHLRVEFQDQTARIRVGQQEPLVVRHLAHAQRGELLGLWTYLPAYFANLRVGDDAPDFGLGPEQTPNPELPAGTVREWFLEGFGVVHAEATGILNLNRHLPVSEQAVRLTREMRVDEAGEFVFHLGFSDEITFQIDGEEVFTGENLFHVSPKWEERGYVRPDRKFSRSLSKGTHRLTAVLKAREYFGFGLALRLEGAGYHWLPAELCP